MRIKSYKTKRLEIRPLAIADFRRWYEAHENSKPKLDKFDIDPWPRKKRTRAIFKKAVLHHRRMAAEDRAYIWNIFLRGSGELIGHLDVSTISRDPHQMANLGYFIINTYRGNGYAREALQKIVPSAFRDLKFHRLEAVTDLDNKASIKVALGCGLYREGIKKHYWFQNGRWEDQMVFIATPELWKWRR